MKKKEFRDHGWLFINREFHYFQKDRNVPGRWNSLCGLRYIWKDKDGNIRTPILSDGSELTGKHDCEICRRDLHYLHERLEKSIMNDALKLYPIKRKKGFDLNWRKRMRYAMPRIRVEVWEQKR